MNSSNHYDYIIVGAGVAGLQLALAMSSTPKLSKKSVLILDYKTKDTNDKTFSFWEKGKGHWDHLVKKSWNKATCISPEGKPISFNLSEYHYKTIDAIDFYTSSIAELSEKPNIYFKHEKVVGIIENNQIVRVITSESEYTSVKAFDSRITVSLEEIKNTSIYVNQSFLGYTIEFDTDVFDDSTFTMMDYSLQWEGSTSFVYVLPFSKRKALVEYTFFAPFTPAKEIFSSQLEMYLTKKFQNQPYNILEQEYGEIPMTNYNFSKFSTANCIKIGTAGGWVKPSSGYSFKATETYVTQIIEGILNNKIIIPKPKRFLFYDNLLLSILKNENKKGGNLFFSMYERLKIDVLFKFLDEKTSFLEEVKLILKLPYAPFIRALFRK